MVGKQIFPVAKNGKFIGYADAKQIAQNDSLELFDETKARTASAEVVIEDAAKEAKTKKQSEDDAAGKGSDPAAVRKGPAKK